ncbi:conserved hypothetical protein [Histoplasma capsulatum G186AR]|uniref:Uncharacterized protein n=1 Tax=Ajellomyces capsulatus (strain G186AR / H82 / ATCC MYA-2454 / RMSCC 2432) TaxID=447093 RepID=C0NYN1_AJECG|nr:uncharacterized protein HCBG_08261 [Histoplasma capsulatum G186AR]EEH03321.1 conserved hypothetical protein [Histoplasma capsulatum G186AR]
MPPATDASVPSKPNARVAKNVLCIIVQELKANIVMLENQENVQLVNVPVSVPSQRIINISRKLVRVAKEPQVHLANSRYGVPVSTVDSCTCERALDAESFRHETDFTTST